MSRLNRAWQASLLLGVLASGTFAFAQPPGRGARGEGPPGGPGGFRGGGPPPEMMMRMIPVLDALDADDDGTISAEEIENATAALKKIDKNGDGKLTQDEIRPDLPAGGGPPGGFGGRGGFGPPDADGRRPGGFQTRRGRASQGDDDDKDSNDKDSNDKEEDEGDDDEDESAEEDGGRLSAEELTVSLRAMVMRADVNRDGFVTGNELVVMLRRGGFGGPPGDGDSRAFFGQMFRTRDANQDGFLKGDEIPEQMSGRLEQIDRDGDGAVSREEMEGMIGRMREGGFGPGRGRGGPGAGGPPAGGPRRGRPGTDGEEGRSPGGDLPRRPETEPKPESE